MTNVDDELKDFTGPLIVANEDESSNKLAVMPVMDIDTAVERYEQMVDFVQRIMKPNIDFGQIPGTEKDTLLKPGAEKLTTFFGLTPRFLDERVLEDDSDPDNPYFFYRRKCQLYRGDQLIGEGSGSCNSRETKYRWREAKRTCPNCGEATVRRSKEKFGGGWYCWAKIGGCGSNFIADDVRITEQITGRIENEDIADLANTILKMADKRALIAATLIACNASEFFTQDIEDLSPAGENGWESPKQEHPSLDQEINQDITERIGDDPATRYWAATKALGITRDTGLSILAECTNNFKLAFEKLQERYSQSDNAP
jgi:hypothetical protein